MPNRFGTQAAESEGIRHQRARFGKSLKRYFEDSLYRFDREPTDFSSVCSGWHSVMGGDRIP